MNIYVGNLPYSITDSELQDMFQEFGNVTSAKVIVDRETDRSKGFGFVELDDANGAAAAIEALDGREMGGRRLRVNEAQDRPRRNGGGGGGGPRGGGGGDRQRRY
ncbi:MAG: RNA recognition motif domain-containing protein [Planctomycetota bacterium]